MLDWLPASSSPHALVRAVASRLIVLWAFVNVSSVAYASNWFTLMVSAWALSEPFRYLFYIVSAYTKVPPYWLSWVRYSLFIVLYPAGITGAFPLWLAQLLD